MLRNILSAVLIVVVGVIAAPYLLTFKAHNMEVSLVVLIISLAALLLLVHGSIKRG